VSLDTSVFQRRTQSTLEHSFHSRTVRKLLPADQDPQIQEWMRGRLHTFRLLPDESRIAGLYSVIDRAMNAYRRASTLAAGQIYLCVACISKASDVTAYTDDGRMENNIHRRKKCRGNYRHLESLDISDSAKLDALHSRKVAAGSGVAWVMGNRCDKE